MARPCPSLQKCSGQRPDQAEIELIKAQAVGKIAINIFEGAHWLRPAYLLYAGPPLARQCLAQ